MPASTLPVELKELVSLLSPSTRGAIGTELGSFSVFTHEPSLQPRKPFQSDRTHGTPASWAGTDSSIHPDRQLSVPVAPGADRVPVQNSRPPPGSWVYTQEWLSLPRTGTRRAVTGWGDWSGNGVVPLWRHSCCSAWGRRHWRCRGEALNLPPKGGPMQGLSCIVLGCQPNAGAGAARWPRG